MLTEQTVQALSHYALDVSLAAAREEYGVVINPDTREIDHEETMRLRRERQG